MSQENVEIVRRLFEGWSRGDLSIESDLLDPDIEYVSFFGPDEVRARGPEDMRRSFASYLGSWEEWRTGEIERLIDSGDKIVVLHRIHARGKHSQAEVEIPNAGCGFEFRNGRIIRLVPCASGQRALEAIGLSE